MMVVLISPMKTLLLNNFYHLLMKVSFLNEGDHRCGKASSMTLP